MSLVYVVLIALALKPEAGPFRSSASDIQGNPEFSIGLVVSAAIAVVSTTFLLAATHIRGQLTWLMLLTFSIAVHCGMNRLFELSVSLAISVIGLCTALFREWKRGEPVELIQFIPAWKSSSLRTDVKGSPDRMSGGIVAATGVSLALLLIGTQNYWIRSESIRSMASSQTLSQMTAETIRNILHSTDSTDNFESKSRDDLNNPNENLIDLVFGNRADVLVLLATLTFLVLALLSGPRADVSDHPKSAETNLSKQTRSGMSNRSSLTESSNPIQGTP